jgi:hypothetical protein
MGHHVNWKRIPCSLWEILENIWYACRVESFVESTLSGEIDVIIDLFPARAVFDVVRLRRMNDLHKKKHTLYCSIWLCKTLDYTIVYKDFVLYCEH